MKKAKTIQQKYNTYVEKINGMLNLSYRDEFQMVAQDERITLADLEDIRNIYNEHVELNMRLGLL